MEQPYIYTEDEKQIFIDHLVYKKSGCRQKFIAYLEDFIKTHGEEVSPEHRIAVAKHLQSVNPIHAQLKNWRYETHNVLWGNDKNDNLVTFILSHPDFEVTNSRMKDLNKVHPDWNHKNHDGNTALHLLAQRGQIHQIEQVVKDFPLDVDIKNKDGDYFTFLLFTPSIRFRNNIDEFELDVLRAISYVNQIFKVVKNYPHHFESASKSKIERIAHNYENLKNNIVASSARGQTIDAIRFKDRFEEFFIEQSKDLDTFINFFLMKKNLKIPSNDAPKFKI